MVVFAILLNVIMIVVVFVIADREIYGAMERGNNPAFHIFLLLGVLAFLVLNIMALWSSKSESWLGLYFKRKKPVERKTVEEDNK